MTEMPLLDDRELIFLDAFEEGSLSPDNFDHEAHVYAAWCCLMRYGDPAGRDRFVAALKRFVRLHGAADKYHETMTRAFLELIASLVESNTGWSTFRNRHGHLIDDGLDPLLRHYSRARLFSDTARNEFLPPDLAPLPDASSVDGREEE